MCTGVVNADDISRGSKVKSLQKSASNAAMYCVLKGLNISRQHLEVVKHVKLGTLEAILPCAPKMKRFDSRNLGAKDISVCSVNLIRGNNSDALAEVQPELEWRFAYLGEEERQTLMPVMILGQGMPCLLRRILTVYHMHCKRR